MTKTMGTMTPGQQSVMAMFDRGERTIWQAKYGRPEITEPHYPIGWLPLDVTPELHQLLKAGAVRLVELPHRANPERTVSFVVRVLSDIAAIERALDDADAEDQRDAADPPVGYVATCPTCGESFNPSGPDDLTHVKVDEETANGEDCGTATEYWSWR